MATRTLLTFEQFEGLQDDGKKHELIRGEHIETWPANLRHARIRQRIQDLLKPYVIHHAIGKAYVAAGFHLSRETWLQPDVSFVRTVQITASDPDGYYEGAPALAIEVVSESNTAVDLDVKLQEYFAHGAEEVWLVYPKTQRVWIYYPDGRSRSIATGSLKSALFPGWYCETSSIFEQ
jgi:Uma2 family endonuclease